MPTTDRFRYLLRRYIDGNSSPGELQELYALLPQVEDEALADLVDEEYEVISELSEKHQADWDRLFTNITAATPAPKRIHWWRYAAAAAVVLGIAGTLYLYNGPAPKTTIPVTQQTTVKPAFAGATLTLSNGQQIELDSLAEGALESQGSTKVTKANGRLIYSTSGNGQGEVIYNTIATTRGRFFQLELPDGSKVWLNAKSSLQYPSAFTDKHRTVTLTGEGYFDVVPDAGKPFKVITGQHTVEVLGTGFNINAYAGRMITTLVEGAVNVRNAAGQAIRLNPGQQTTADGQAIATSGADIKKVTAWKDGEFRFRGDGLFEIMDQLSNWYDIDVRYTGQIPEKHYSGRIGRHASIDEVLEMLHVLTGARFTLNGTVVTVNF